MSFLVCMRKFKTLKENRFELAQVSNGLTYNSFTYSADPSLQVLVDNHLHTVTLS